MRNPPAHPQVDAVEAHLWFKAPLLFSNLSESMRLCTHEKAGCIVSCCRPYPAGEAALLVCQVLQVYLPQQLAQAI